MVNEFSCLDDNPDREKLLSIVFQNVMGLKPHQAQIKADFGIMSGDILLFAECHTNPNNKLTIEEFDILRYTGSVNLNASNGLVCYVRKNLQKQ